MRVNHSDTVQQEDNSLWKGFKKRNPYVKKVNPNTVENFSKDRREIYAILARVSTDMQFKEGDSFDAQIERAKRLIEKKGGELYNIYREEGISAYNNTIDERPVMQQLKQDILDGKVNHLVVYKRNRISRRQKDRKDFFEFLKENGCKLTLTSTGEEVDISGKDKLSAITEDLQGHFDEISSKETSENVTDTMWELAAYKGRIMGGQAPVGYQTVYEERDADYGNRIPKFVPIEEFQPTRELIEELYLSGYGYGTIARYLNGGKVKGLEQLPVPVKKLK